MQADQRTEGLDESTRAALSTVFERSDGGRRELQWQDVSDAVSSDQWGRLIGEGHLVSREEGFALADPDAVAEHLDSGAADDEDTGDDSFDVEPESWGWHDKAAGLVAIVFFAGYLDAGVRDVIASFDDVVLSPVTHALPFYAVVLLLAVVTGFYSTVLQSRLSDNEKMQRYKDRMEDIKARKEAAEERGDEEAVERIKEEQMEAAGDQLGMFKLQFRPMVWIMLLTIPVFLWLRWKVRGGHLGVAQTGLIVPFAGSVGWQDPLFGPMSTWIVWYFLCSMASRQVIRKALGVRPGGAAASTSAS
ncbi:MAG: DUF106 domain-containing protein [Halorientalis sp.]